MRRLLAAGVVAVVSVSGCSADRGDERAREITADLADVDGIESVSLGGRNVLPYSGYAEGIVALEDGLPETRVAEIVHLLGSYATEE